MHRPASGFEGSGIEIAGEAIFIHSGNALLPARIAVLVSDKPQKQIQFHQTWECVPRVHFVQLLLARSTRTAYHLQQLDYQCIIDALVPPNV